MWYYQQFIYIVIDILYFVSFLISNYSNLLLIYLVVIIISLYIYLSIYYTFIRNKQIFIEAIYFICFCTFLHVFEPFICFQNRMLLYLKSFIFPSNVN